MSRNYQPVELNTFVGGLITEASPLTFPQNASLDEVNFVLNNNGSRSRRLGMDLENGFNYVDVTNPLPTDGSRLIVNSFKWENAGGLASKTIIVVQVGAQLDFFDNDIVPLSSGRISSSYYEDTGSLRRFSFASVDGKLVVASGEKTVDVYIYDTVLRVISKTQQRLVIRDLFGLEDKTSTGVDLRSGSNISIRPESGDITTAHVYNLRNQTWAIPRVNFDGFGGNDNAYDALTLFRNSGTTKWPSNADNIIPYLYANTSAVGNKSILRFNAGDARLNPLGNSYAPIGYFIIDALDRGNSRRSELQNLTTKYPENASTGIDLSSIPVDSSTSGPTTICEFAGRVFYAGFSGEVIGADNNSPKMSSYVLFSQLVKDLTDINACYQQADPTDKNDSNLVDTDGGFLRIQGAFDIVGMVNLGNTLLVFANNGVWSVSGGNSYGFTATNYKVTKLTNAGCLSPGSIVNVESGVLYWSRDGIYNISQNQYGDYGAVNITIKTIQKYYNSIPESVSRYSEGVYDSFEKQVKWVYYEPIGSLNPQVELVLDMQLGAFYKHEIYPNTSAGFGTVGYPIVVKGIQTNPFAFTYSDENILVGPAQVQVGIDNVVVNSRTEIDGTKEVVYLILLGPHIEVEMSYSFGTYKDLLHFDWTSLGYNLDAFSYMITGYLSGGDYQRNKQIVYLTVHCERTETPDGAGGLTNQSSCQTQIQWDWSNDQASNRWTRQFQAYRLFGPYYPNDTGDYQTKFNVIETRNKIRGTGKVISIMFNSEAGQHLTLLGWSINMGVEGNV